MYKIVKGDNTGNVEEQVNELIKTGYELVGGLQVTAINMGHPDAPQSKMLTAIYAQALIKTV